MPASVQNEPEIILGDKQLLLVFALVAVLLAVAFGAGYMLGKGSGEKRTLAISDPAQTSLPVADVSGGPITQKIVPDDAQTPKSVPAVEAPLAPEPAVETRDAARKTEPVLGENNLGEHSRSSAPRPGENYVQVTAVARKVADATADVLRQHGFSARVAPAPGNAGIFRVLVGPERDTAELRNTEDKLRKIGYTKCFVQHY
jgi:cell division septation protein DedD